MSGKADAVVGDTALREVVGPDLCTAVAGRDKRLAAAGNIVDILLMLVIIDICVQTAQCTLLVLRLVTGLGTFNENLLDLPVLGFFHG